MVFVGYLKYVLALPDDGVFAKVVHPAVLIAAADVRGKALQLRKNMVGVTHGSRSRFLLGYGRLRAPPRCGVVPMLL